MSFISPHGYFADHKRCKKCRRVIKWRKDCNEAFANSLSGFIVYHPTEIYMRLDEYDIGLLRRSAYYVKTIDWKS